MTNIQIRINEKDKEEAKVVLDKLGMDMSSAIKLFLKQTALRKGLPFLVVTENNLTLEEEYQILRASQDSRKGKNLSKPLKGKEPLKYLQSL